MINTHDASSSPVDGWIAANVDHYNRDLSLRQISSLGKETVSRIKRIWLKILYVLSLSYYNPTKYYVECGQKCLLQRNISMLSNALTEQRLRGRSPSLEKMRRVSLKIQREVELLLSCHAISFTQVMTYGDNQKKLKKIALKELLKRNHASWMSTVGFDPQAEKNSLSLLKLVEALRKGNKGDAFADWLEQNKVEEPLKMSINRYIDSVTERFGVLDACYRDKRVSATNPFAVVKEIFQVESSLAQLSQLCDKYGLSKIYLEVVENSFGNRSKAYSPEQKMEPIDFSHQKLIAALQRLEAISQGNFCQEGMSEVFIRVASATIRDEMDCGKKTPLRAVKGVAAYYEKNLDSCDEGSRIEGLCKQLACELNSMACRTILPFSAKPPLFNALFVKKYLMDGPIGERLDRLEALAHFARGEEFDQMLNFIEEIDPIWSTQQLHKGQSDRGLLAAMRGVYGVYRSSNEGQASALLKSLGESPLFISALGLSDIANWEKNMGALKNLMIYTNAVIAKKVYDAEVVIEGIRIHMERQASFLLFVRGLDRKGKDALYGTIFGLFVRCHASISLGKQHGSLFLEGLNSLFGGRCKFPESHQLEYVKELVKAAGAWFLNGSSSVEILSQLTAARGKTIHFELNRIQKGDIENLRLVALPTIERELAQTLCIKKPKDYPSNIFEMAEKFPEKLVTALVPVIFESLLQSQSDKSRAIALKEHLKGIEAQMTTLDAVKNFGGFFLGNKDVITIVSLLPAQECSRLATQILDALLVHSFNRKNQMEESPTVNAVSFVATRVLDMTVSLLAEKISEARNTNIGKLPLPSHQEFYDSFPNIKAITSHWAYKSGLRLAPSLLSLVGRSGFVGRKLSAAAVQLCIKMLAKKNMSPKELADLTVSIGPAISVLFLVVSSFLRRHEVKEYFSFLHQVSEYLHQETMTTPESEEDFRRQIWNAMHYLFSDLQKDYPLAIAQILHSIADLAHHA